MKRGGECWVLKGVMPHKGKGAEGIRATQGGAACTSCEGAVQRSGRPRRPAGARAPEPPESCAATLQVHSTARGRPLIGSKPRDAAKGRG